MSASRCGILRLLFLLGCLIQHISSHLILRMRYCSGRPDLQMNEYIDDHGLLYRYDDHQGGDPRTLQAPYSQPFSQPRSRSTYFARARPTIVPSYQQQQIPQSQFPQQAFYPASEIPRAPFYDDCDAHELDDYGPTSSQKHSISRANEIHQIEHFWLRPSLSCHGSIPMAPAA